MADATFYAIRKDKLEEFPEDVHRFLLILDEEGLIDHGIIFGLDCWIALDNAGMCDQMWIDCFEDYMDKFPDVDDESYMDWWWSFLTDNDNVYRYKLSMTF